MRDLLCVDAGIALHSLLDALQEGAAGFRPAGVAEYLVVVTAALVLGILATFKDLLKLK